MRPFLTTIVALMTAAAPLAAAADPGGHGRGHDRDRHESRGDRHDHHRGHDHAGRRGDRVVYVREKWRGRPEWKSYGGPRSGYWYAPGYGYRPVARTVVWRRGAYLPPPYRTYYVQEPVYYGLAPAPRGHRWVYGDDSFVMIALATGLITSVVAMSDGPPPAPYYEAPQPRYEPPPPPPPRYYEERYVERREEPAVIARNEDVWRGSDGEYHCRKPNGTTGLVVGAAAGALVGRAVDGGRDRTTGTVLGAAGGALLGREIERGNARCQ